MGLVALIVGWVVASAAPLHVTMISSMGLERVTHEAARIAQGTVTEVRSGRDESGLPATWVTLAVARTLKGPAEARLTFKQYGVATLLPDGTVARVAGLPGYRVGEEILLFLRGTSPHGFTSPVGLVEGVYRVNRGNGHPEARTDLPPGEETRDLAPLLAEVARLAAQGP